MIRAWRGYRRIVDPVRDTV